MFAQPRWFDSSSKSFLPATTSWKGKAFYTICLAGVLVPALVLITRQQIFPELLIWTAFSVIAFMLEMRGLRRDLRQQEALENMYYIDEESTPVETEQYELQLKA